MVDEKFWRNRKVFITGHSGFKGTWLTLMLDQIGAKVTGFSLPLETSPNSQEPFSSNPNIRSYLGNIDDLEFLKKALADTEPEIVFHLAAQSIVRKGYKDPSGTFRTNIIGTSNVLDAIRCASSVKAVVIVTSDKVYAHRHQSNCEGYAFREQDDLGGNDPYSLSKALAESIVDSYKTSLLNKDNVAIATARAGNVIGGGDWGEDRIVPDIVRALTGTGQLILRHPNASRSWMHVLDVLNGYLVLAENLFKARKKFSGAWNFAPYNQKTISVKILVKQFLDNWGTSLKTLIQPDPNAPESLTLLIDPTKSKTLMEWKTLLDFDEMLNWTSEWYKIYTNDPGSTYKLTQLQIQKFMSLSIENRK